MNVVSNMAVFSSRRPIFGLQVCDLNWSEAFTFVSGREIYGLQNMIRYARLAIRRERVPSLDQVEEARENVFFERLRATLDAKQFRSQDRMIDRLLDQGYGSSDIAAALIHLLTGGQPGSPGTSADGSGGAAETDTLPAPKVSRPYDDESRPPLPVPSPPAPAPKPKPAAHKPAPKFVPPAETAAPRAGDGEEARPFRPAKQKYQRAARTGREPGYTTLFLNIGRKNLITPADVVGKIAGVTRLPAAVVGAMDIHQRHTLVDVLSENADFVVAKMQGIRVKNVALAPALATDEHRAEPQD